MKHRELIEIELLADTGKARCDMTADGTTDSNTIRMMLVDSGAKFQQIITLAEAAQADLLDIHIQAKAGKLIVTLGADYANGFEEMQLLIIEAQSKFSAISVLAQQYQVNNLKKVKQEA